ncbi:hypothetical protein [Streptomyces mirabilis]|uniref:hypothetical protein n=1 Tax=Streptomyces mirabilis TaxID=68239 RepID=UPI0033238BDD
MCPATSSWWPGTPGGRAAREGPTPGGSACSTSTGSRACRITACGSSAPTSCATWPPLNGVELLPWDAWGPEILDDAALDADELALIDSVAAAGGEDELRRLYRDPRLTVPDEIVSYTTYGGVRKVTLGRT